MVLDNVLSAFFLAISVYIYVSLARQIRARVVEIPPIPVRLYGWPEATIAILLTLWFLLNVAASASYEVKSIHTAGLIIYAVFSIGLLLAISGFLRLRRFDLDTLGGFSKTAFGRVVVTAALLLLAAYPPIVLAENLTQRLARGNLEKQEIIEVFNSSSTLEQRILIIVLAVVVAPLTEEFFFRFFLYGVTKRYFGRSAGVLANALLFAAVHAHLPSFAPLCVLGICLTIAYEWSGSILVSMTMHALFNALALTALAFPEMIPQ